MTRLIALLTAAWLCGLVWEKHRCDAARRKIQHVVHVNGTRGKSTVSRMIEAGLRAGGTRVFCKTTGTDPMVIDVQGSEIPIRRRGKANIKEQVGILCQAAAQDAQVLVIECMAVQPEFQAAAQHQILNADIGVITNVRRDHTDVMGDTLPEICDALCNTVPRGGTLFTAEVDQAPRMARAAEKLDCAFYPVRPDGSEPDFDFGENIALALAVCQFLGVERETALGGICAFHRDPYALSIHRLGDGLFVNGLSINDIQSTCMVWRQLKDRLGAEAARLILLVNNRADRGSRTQDMKKTCLALRPEEVWLLGAAQGYMSRGVKRQLPGAVIRTYRSASELELAGLHAGEVVFAIGNIAGEGRALMARVREEGEPYV
jgi:poly-gamma-glutamate synthase PgsB/CapB